MKKRLIGCLVCIFILCGMCSIAFAVTSATSLLGAKDITCRVGETICIKKSDFQLYPAGSRINNVVSYKDADFSMYGYNHLFNGNSDYYIQTTDDDIIQYITPYVPGYYSVYAYAYYEDEMTGEEFAVDSDFFILTVLDQNGNAPEPNPSSVEIFSIPSVTVGESVQINWLIDGYYRPFTDIIRILKNGRILDEWDYEATDRDTYVFSSAGTYQIQILMTDGLGRTVTDKIDVNVIQPKSLILKSLTLQNEMERSDESLAVYSHKIRWELDYEGGYGTKTTEIHLINAETNEDKVLYDNGFFPAMTQNVDDGTFFIRMNVKDNEGDHWIDSNTCTTLHAFDWDFWLPDGLRRIEANAFENTTAQTVRINYGCLSIGENAFADSSLRGIFIPPSVISIGDNAIPDGVVVIFTPPGSWAAKWARIHHYFVVYDS